MRQTIYASKDANKKNVSFWRSFVVLYFRRERVKKAKEASKLATKKGKSAKSEESQKEPTNVSDESSLDADKVAVNTTPPKRPDLKELTKGLPAGWQVLGVFRTCCSLISFSLFCAFFLAILLLITISLLIKSWARRIKPKPSFSSLFLSGYKLFSCIGVQYSQLHPFDV